MTTTPTTATQSTLTDRYVEATLRRLPGRQRLDIERELRSSIADAIDDRVSAGEEPAAAETAVLTGLGDPARLAASYANRPLYLIGPELFVDYTRVLTAILVTVVPIVAVVIAMVHVFQHDTLGGIIGGAIGVAITTAVHIAFWVTVVFAIVERVRGNSGGRSGPLVPWTPDALPAPPSRRQRYGELIAGSVMTVVFCAFILWSPTLGFRTDVAGRPIPVLSPWLWETGMVYLFLALVVASLGVTFVRHYARWRLPVAVAGVLVQIAPSAMMIWLATNDRIVNPAFIESAGWPESATRWIGPAFIIFGGIGILSTISETIRHGRNHTKDC